ncbi:hypothetical protein [Thermomonospora amylolytica]|uniref:hypothetical protein n=1 Tax=Thermomonospora amylolytica TaxID=1411117 RepID=UPI000E6C0692|nr:hypothetical protein [Thermomonospora amylolytica]
MGKVVVDISMSLDGFVAAGRTPDEPLGTGGERLHEWAFGQDERSRALLEEAVGDLGAVITGRTTYDDSVRWWCDLLGEDRPFDASGTVRRGDRHARTLARATPCGHCDDRPV